MSSRYALLALCALFAHQAAAICVFGIQVNYYSGSSCNKFLFSKSQCLGECYNQNAESAMLIVDNDAYNLGAWSSSGCHYNYAATPKHMCDYGRWLNIGATKVWSYNNSTRDLPDQKSMLNLTFALGVLDTPPYADSFALIPISVDGGKHLVVVDLAASGGNYTGNVEDYGWLAVAELDTTHYKMPDLYEPQQLARLLPVMILDFYNRTSSMNDMRSA